MKRLIFSLMLVLSAAMACLAQSDEELMKQAMERYKDMQTLTAPVTQTKHNVALQKDQVAKGQFYFKKPDSMVLTFNDGKDMLLMRDRQFTMVSAGKATTMSGKNEQMEALKSLLASFTAGEESDVALEDLADVDVEREGTRLTMTVTPIVSDPKAKRRMMYTSFVVTIDTKEGALKTLRLNEKGKNYTQYDFGKFTVDAAVDDAVFEVR